MGDELLLLLAMGQAAGKSRSALVHQLLRGARPATLRSDPRWDPTGEHMAFACRALIAVAALDLVVVPAWHLPAPFLRRSPPVAMFVRGDSGLLTEPGIGIVGSRRACVSACGWAARLAREVVGSGKVVVSGGARGIDGAAHRGALDAGGKTVAYIGVPADHIYPAAHRTLFEDMIRSGGALVSEHAPGQETFAPDHAKRNRFIAAHSQRLYIAEADARSGSLGTARFARSLQVPVWVSPPGVARRRAGLDELLAKGRAKVAPGPTGRSAD